MGNLILSQALYHHLPTPISQSHLAEHARRSKYVASSDLHRETNNQPSRSAVASSRQHERLAERLTHKPEGLPSFSEVMVAEAHRGRGREIRGPQKSGTWFCLPKRHSSSVPTSSAAVERNVPRQRVLSALNTLRKLAACPGKEENAKEQRTGNSLPGCTATAKNVGKVQHHEKLISTQSKDKMRVLDGTNTPRSLAVFPKGCLHMLTLSLSTACPTMKETSNPDNSSVLQFFQVKYLCSK